MTRDALLKLQQLAQAATPGPWSQVEQFPLLVVPAADAKKPVGGSVFPEQDAGYARTIAKVIQDTPDYEGWERFKRRRFDKARNKADAAFIAAVNPAVVLDMVASLLAQWDDE